jgi:hypothetical protein
MQLLFQLVDAHLAGVFQNYQVMPVAFVIPEEEIFAMRGIQVFPVLHGNFYGWSRRVFMVIEGNSKPGKGFVQQWGSVHGRGV